MVTYRKHPTPDHGQPFGVSAALTDRIFIRTFMRVKRSDDPSGNALRPLIMRSGPRSSECIDRDG